jgi:hypothetical protein
LSHSNRMFVLILSPYKTATCWLENFFHLLGIPVKKLHGYESYEQTEIAPIEQVTHCVTIQRYPISRLWASAMFEDLSVAQYPYHYGSERQCEEATVDDLIRHFREQPWESWTWLNFEYYTKKLDWLSTNHGKKVLTLTIDHQCESMSSEDQLTKQILEKFPEFLALSENSVLSALKSCPRKSHEGRRTKWGYKYEEFLKNCYI